MCSGVNLLVGTENGLMLLDRSGQGKVYNLITRRRFLQMDVLEGLNVLVTISGRSNTDTFKWSAHPVPLSLVICYYVLLTAELVSHIFAVCFHVCSPKFNLIALSTFVPRRSGKKNKLRVYYLSWLRNRILHNDPEVEKKQGWITVGELEGCVHYKVGKDLWMCVYLE